MSFILDIFLASWQLLQEASIYVLFGIFVAGMLRIFISPAAVAKNLGRGRFTSVLKAALLGIPIPLCSCGVLPAAASLNRQGANKGATTAFLISAPETGIDSVALTYALMDPVMTIARPVSAFATATAAGVAENFRSPEQVERRIAPDLSCPVDGCCEGVDCPPEEHGSHHTFSEKLRSGFRYAIDEIWEDISVWFLVGIILAGLITTLVPTELIPRYLGGGLPAMLIMLAAGIPLYICATASTPIAAALILKGVSPGAALVFLLAGPATNITSLTVLLKILGRRSTAIYLSVIALSAILLGLALDQVYSVLGVSAQALAGHAAEVIPHWAKIGGVFILLVLSFGPVHRRVRSWLKTRKQEAHSAACHCTSESSGNPTEIGHGDFIGGSAA